MAAADDDNFDDIFAMMQSHYAPPAPKPTAAPAVACRPDAAGEVDSDGEAGFEDVFDMMQSHFGPAPGKRKVEPAMIGADRAAELDALSGKLPTKRLREGEPEPQEPEEAQAAQAATEAAPEPEVGDGEGSDPGEQLAEPSGGAPTAPPPEAVVAAFGLLDLPLTSTQQEVSRRARILSRAVHPDKVAAPGSMISIEGRTEAMQKFWELQAAKAAVLAWLQMDAGEKAAAQGADGAEAAAESGDESEVESESQDDAEAQDTMRAVGFEEGEPGFWEVPGGRAFGEEAPSSEEDVAGSSAGPLAAGAASLQAADLSGGVIVSQDSILEQAAALSQHLEALRAAGVRQCEECFERKPLPDEAVCLECKRELRRLWRGLQRPVRP